MTLLISYLTKSRPYAYENKLKESIVSCGFFEI